ncbi:MAG: peptide ABC transporter substrate-binding protein [Firmicutes bacterium]|nr:peptide ABC transporter substrate-binding protein [Bacillota bacterium]
MKKRKLLALMLALAMVFSLVLTGCAGGGEEPADEPEQQEEPKDDDTDKPEDTSDSEEDSGLAEEQVLKINWRSEPPNLDPQISQDATSSRILIDTLEGIIRMNDKGQVEEGSGMAKSWDVNEDGTKYTFHLRDAKWSDGKKVTAGDFAFSWKRALAPETGSTYAFIAYDIKNGEAYNTGKIDDPSKVGVTAKDDNTLVVELESPNPAFLSKLQHSTFLPAREDLLEKYGEKYGSEVEYLPSCGPFKITEWAHEQELVMEKNDNYWDADAVKLERIEGVMVRDSNTTMNLYETGQLDWVLVPSQYLEKYKEKLQKSPEAACFYYTFNTKNEFFQNVKIRKAFTMAIDREKILELRTHGITPPAFGFVPPGMPGPGDKTFREANGDQFYDLGKGSEVKDEVNKLFEEGLKEIGKTREDMNGTKFLTYDSDNSLQVAQIWQQAWKENLGVDIEIEQATFKIKIDRENKGDFAFSYSGWIGDYNDPMTFMDMWVTGGSQNTANWSNEEYDKLIKKAQTTSGEERMQAMLDAEKILLDEFPIAPYDFSVRSRLQKPYVKGVIRLPLQMTNGLKYAYIAK